MRNQLLLGDSTELLREIPDESVDLILTDPHYNTGIKGSPSGTRFRNFFDDALSPTEYRELVATTARELFRVLRMDRAAYVFINWKSLGIWLDELSRAGFRLKNVIVWDKVVHGINYQNYAYTHEFLIFAVKGRFFPRNKRTHDDSYRDLWHIQRETRQPKNDDFHHETVKPAALVRRPIEHASVPGDLVLDPFFGSGRILVVAKELGRDYLGIERDPRFYRMGVRSVEKAAAPAATIVFERNPLAPAAVETCAPFSSRFAESDMASSLEVVCVPRTRLRERDIEALAFIGRGFEVAQYQLHEAIFASRSPNVVSRFVVRASERSFVAAERLGGIGMNRLRLTRRGREFLIDRGIGQDELFAPAKAVALKDVAHTLAINDLRVALLGLQNRPTLISPAWFLQRRLSSALAIPDLLARWPAGTGTRGLLLACEIDLGGERLATIFLPKLERLRELLNDAAEGDRAGIVVFTRGNRRVELLGLHAGEGAIPVMALTIPSASGSREGILEFRSLLARC